ncbi:Myosin light chain kinase [Binucleata daphniae]
MLLFLTYCLCVERTIFECITTINDAFLVTNKDERMRMKEFNKNNDKKEMEMTFNNANAAIIHLREYNLVLKRVNNASKDNLEGEISTVLNHENIITTYLSFKQKINDIDVIWLIMEKLECDAFDYCNDYEDVDNFKICQDVCKGIKYLHERKMVHIDIKLENVGVKKRGNVIDDKAARAIIQMHADVKSHQNRKYYANYFFEILHNKDIFDLDDDNITVEKNMQNVSTKLKLEHQNTDCNAVSSNKEDESLVYVILDFGTAQRYQERLDDNYFRFDFVNECTIVAKEIYEAHRFTLKTDIFNFGLLCLRLYFEDIDIPKIKPDKMVRYEQMGLEQFRAKISSYEHKMKDIILECIKDEESERPDIDKSIDKLKNIVE